jgi:hypothetical protein
MKFLQRHQIAVLFMKTQKILRGRVQVYEISGSVIFFELAACMIEAKSPLQ